MNISIASTTAASVLFWCLLLLAGLSFLACIFRRIKLEHNNQQDLVEKINCLLPQTQCGQCGYEGCRPYALAISQGQATNQCPPGGVSTLIKLAELVNDEIRPLNPAHGQIEEFKTAVIREDECIGCTKCIKACPVDAILGGPKLMHTVIQNECTGCDLCVEPCPVDCIDMVALPATNAARWRLPTSIGVREQKIGVQL